MYLQQLFEVIEGGMRKKTFQSAAAAVWSEHRGEASDSICFQNNSWQLSGPKTHTYEL